MTEPKTKPNDLSAEDFINGLENDTRRQDSLKLLEIFNNATGLEPTMWGTSIVGYGVYQVNKSDWPLVGFSPRKQNLTLYVEPNNFPELLKNLGKHTTSTACLYITKLEDVDLAALEKLVAASFASAKERHA